MSSVFLQTIGPLTTALLYLAAAVFLFRSVGKQDRRQQKAALLITAAAVVLHVGLQANTWLKEPLAMVDVSNAFSICSLILVLLWALSLARKNAALESGLFALPIAAAACLLEWLVPGPVISETQLLEGPSPGTVVHIVSSLLAFGLLSLAGVYALLVLVVDHSLKRHDLSTFVRSLPPLDQLEKLLFRLVATGFGFLTVGLVSGLLYVDDLMARHLVHKTILAILAWVVFGALLAGRWLKGWRGAMAVRLTLAGIALLLLSYFGSKFVLEVVLDRSWYTDS